MSLQAEGTPGRPDGSARRLFFALWPEPATLTRLTGVLRELAPPGVGRPQRGDQLHLTLEFLGSVPEARVRDALEAGRAAAAGARPFEFVLDSAEHWRRPQVLCLAASATPEPLDHLVRILRVELAARGFEPDRRSFRAHLTLARKVRRELPASVVEPVTWPATELSLVESTTLPSGSRYTRLATWPLGA
jgi:2'-5' RNA ligase